MQVDSKSLVNSMVWNPADQFRHHTSLIPVDKCTQTRFTAVSATRTMIAVQAFQISRYSFAVRRMSQEMWGMWETSEADEFDRWVYLWKEDPGPQKWVDYSYHDSEWGILYSLGGYIRVDGLALLTPGGTMNVQVQSRELPPEACN
jgi:hypothetical protein